MTKINIFPALN